jgi:hypothetical protein
MTVARAGNPTVAVAVVVRTKAVVPTVAARVVVSHGVVPMAVVADVASIPVRAAARADLAARAVSVSAR